MKFYLYLGIAVVLAGDSILRMLNASDSEYFKSLPAPDVVSILAAAALVPLLIALAWNSKQPIYRSMRREPALLIVSILVFGLAGAFLVYDASNRTPVVAAIAATAATIGWVLQRQSALEISRKQHTLTILLQMRQNDIFNRHRINFFSVYPRDSYIQQQDVDRLLNERVAKEKYGIDANGMLKFPVVESIFFICNYYEFLASGIRQGDLDNDLLEQSLRSITIQFYRTCRPLIDKIRDLDEHGKAQSDTLSHYAWLVEEHWKRDTHA